MIHALTHANRTGAPLRVLVADDNSDFAANVAELARLQRLEPRIVSTLAAALGALDADSYDVALVDYRLPDGTATEFLAQARRRQPDLVTVIVTAYASLDGTAAALNEGAFAFVNKDSRAERLLDAIHRAVQTALLRAENRRLRAVQSAILAALPDRLLVVDDALQVLSVNRVPPFFRVDAPFRLPCPLESMLSPTIREKVDVRALVERAAAADPPTASASITALDPDTGRARMFAIEAAVLVADLERLTLIRISELTERIELERRLSESESLATVGRLTAIIAHELRNPIAGIRALCQVLTRRFPGDDPDAESLREMLALTDRMSATLGDLLSYGRPQDGDRGRLPLAELVGEVAREGRRWPASEARTIEVDVARGYAPLVVGERRRLASALSNLLENALQAVPEGGRVLLRLAPDDAAGHCRLTVEDDGPGVHPDVANRLFEPFVTRKARGTGLGLSIVKKVIDAHGGRIEVGRSARLGGAEFRVVLPSVAASD